MARQRQGLLRVRIVAFTLLDMHTYAQRAQCVLAKDLQSLKHRLGLAMAAIAIYDELACLYYKLLEQYVASSGSVAKASPLCGRGHSSCGEEATGAA